MISTAPAPYEKTKILRIVQRTVIINQLDQTIVLKEPYSDWETILKSQDTIDYDFLYSNSRNSLLVRMTQSQEDSKNEDKDIVVEKFG